MTTARCVSVFTLAAALVFLAACAGPRIDWQSRLGTYTFDQAVLELGPPDKYATLTDGTRVAEWLTYRGSPGHTTFGSAFYGHPYHFYGGPLFHYTEPPTPDRYLRLTFSPDGTLQTWRRLAK